MDKEASICLAVKRGWQVSPGVGRFVVVASRFQYLRRSGSLLGPQFSPRPLECPVSGTAVAWQRLLAGRVGSLLDPVAGNCQGNAGTM